jgi:hypothetical protein
VTVATGRPGAGTIDGTGRHRRPGRRRAAGLAGLITSLGAVAALLALPAASPEPTREPAALSVDGVWPQAQRGEVPGNVSDGPAYSPVFFLDTTASLGTAPSPNGTHLRLVLRSSDGGLRELRRLPIASTPQYGGFAVSGDVVAWAESTSDGGGNGHTEMWAASLRSAEPARRLTADTGDVVFFNSQYDMIISDGRLHWVAVAPGKQAATELRSVPLARGRVTVRTEAGAWARSAWPWLVSADSGQSGPVQLRNPVARQVIDVDAAGTELVTCSPVWCRVLVLSGAGPARIDVMRPDGSDRQRMAAGTASASVIDVAVLDRFEVLSMGDAQGSATSGQRLMLYDIKRRQSVTVADRVGMVLCRGGVLWWSTGENENVVWHTLDLRTLS